MKVNERTVKQELRARQEAAAKAQAEENIRQLEELKQLDTQPPDTQPLHVAEEAEHRKPTEAERRLQEEKKRLRAVYGDSGSPRTYSVTLQ